VKVAMPQRRGIAEAMNAMRRGGVSDGRFGATSKPGFPDNIGDSLRRKARAGKVTYASVGRSAPTHELNPPRMFAAAMPWRSKMLAARLERTPEAQ